MKLDTEAEILLSSIGDSQDIVPKFGMERVSQGGDKDSIILHMAFCGIFTYCHELLFCFRAGKSISIFNNTDLMQLDR